MDPDSLPIGFSMALAMNEPAMKAYAAMTQQQRAAVLAKAHNAESKQEMQRIVAEIADSKS